MDKSKIISIVLLVFILVIGFSAYTFYNQARVLSEENEKLKDEKAILIEDNNGLKDRYSRLERNSAAMEQKLSTITSDLSRLEEERDNWKNKYTEISRERDLLVEKLNQPVKAEVSTAQQSSGFSSKTDDQWADFVQGKAALEAMADDLKKALFDAKSRITELDKNNKELSIKIDQLTKEKQRLDEEIKFKERTLRIMSMDLVNEREERGSAVVEVRKLRNENVSLKRELVLANKEKIKLQTDLKGTMEKKDALEGRIMDAENVLKEKSMAFEELQEQLQRAIAGGKRALASETASVELPPIVVKPDAPGLKGLRGEVIAVNGEEKFVVVDIGESSGLRPGALLKIMRSGREIATVEVIETRREISAADIKEVSGGFTVQEGDIVISR
ncbi:MAG: hypothetical protein PHU64_01710 [Candidatus Omnitrophica bacterium]|nr:hypothetical protein [Candidatus Omnitrophota bacterium]MDD5429219.1 hypothetical protein [Candidatus Omnitrophota bacterium]